MITVRSLNFESMVVLTLKANPSHSQVLPSVSDQTTGPDPERESSDMLDLAFHQSQTFQLCFGRQISTYKKPLYH